jgi:hypothetical protein
VTLPPVRPDDPDADAPEWWRRTATYRRIPLLVMFVLVVIFIVAQQGSPAPKLTTNCHSPGFALSTYSTQPHKAVQWSTTGVPGITYAISFSGPEGATQQQFVTGRMPSDCTESGAFGVLLPPGKYVARMTVVRATDGPTDPTHVFEVTQP